MLNAYQREQLEGQRLLLEYLGQMPPELKRQLSDSIRPYLEFRSQVDQFLARHCGRLCTQSCFESRMSACCSRDGIITFWADMVVNALRSSTAQSKLLIRAIQSPLDDQKCIYLGSVGCLWQIRPLVCTMFLCDKVKQELFTGNAEMEEQWSDLNTLALRYRWPDRPVLFDDLEIVFMGQGCRSELMYLNNSPGLLRVKQKAGLM